MYCISSSDNQQLDIGWITVLVFHDLAPPSHRKSCHPTRIQTLHQEGSLSHMWVEFLFGDSNIYMVQDA